MRCHRLADLTPAFTVAADRTGTTVTDASPEVASSKLRPWRTVLVGVVAVGGVGVLALFARSTLADSFTAVAHLQWRWVPLGLFAEASSMAAFARSQRRLLKVGGTPVHLGSVMAVTYAGMRGHHALAAVLVYRLINFWLVMAGGWAVMAMLTRNTRQSAHIANQPAATETTAEGRWAVRPRGRSFRS